MIGDEGADRSAFVVRDTAELMLVASDTAGTGGETLAASALSFWRLPLEPGMARMRALVAGAAAATSPLCRLRVRLVLLDGAVVLEVVFLDADPHDYDSGLMPAGADWSWRRDSGGRWRLCDRIDLHPRRTHERIMQ
ncbi:MULTISPECIES: hypothetical protein [Nocardia]|uniref:hypothetical protein n=1 Tax=Nocardia TaxID=1817 RepID=UPI0024576C9A|nr:MULTISPECIES: hypothetical protein [Nocardia]